MGGQSAEPCLSDRDGFASAYRAHHGAVTSVASRVCGQHHALDVAQDVFVTLWRHPERFDIERGSLRSYLLTLAHHKAVDVLRSETARQRREVRVDVADAPMTATVDDDLLRSASAARVRKAVGGLPAKEREALVIAFYDQRTYREAAAWLGEPEGTIKSRIRSGLQRLHPALIERG